MCLTGDAPAAFTPEALVDRHQLALVAVERTRMPMVITNPRLPDNPIVLANEAFLTLTGYTADEVIGRNCRFLQGPDADPAALATLRDSLSGHGDVTVELLNYRKDGSAFWNQLFISPVRDDAGALLYFFASQQDVTAQHMKQALEREERRLLREVDHRAKNALALVQGIVRLSRADDAQDYAAAVQGRVESLARAHSLLAEQNWKAVSLDRLIRGEIEPFGARRIEAVGPEIPVHAAQVQPLALMLHEMLANAAQHGALSAGGGRVTIHWYLAHDDTEMCIDWTEQGGPDADAERGRGFGSSMIDAIVRRQIKGRITNDWRREGLHSEICVPVAS